MTPEQPAPSHLFLQAQEPECALDSRAAPSWLANGRNAERQKKNSNAKENRSWTRKRSKAITGRWFTSFWGDACYPAIVDELAAPDVILQYSMHSRLGGHLAVKAFMDGFREAFPDLRFREVGALVADRDIVVVRWEGRGTHTGPAFHDFDLGPLPTGSGRRIALSGHIAVRLEDGLIAEEAVWSAERRVQFRPITGGSVLGLSGRDAAAEQTVARGIRAEPSARL